METWKPILGFEGLYEISGLGNVRRIARGKTLTAAKVVQAKKMFAEGHTLKSVAETIGTSIPTAHAIRKGRTWAGDETYRAVKTSVGSDHYLRVTLCMSGVYRRVAIHRALWEAFVGPIPGRMEINHKNLDRQDNRLENLEILTHQQNIAPAMSAYNAERTHLPKGQRSGPRSQYAKIKHT